MQTAARVSKFLCHATGGDGLLARDAFTVYTAEATRNAWITALTEYRDATGRKTTASGRAGYWAAMVKFVRWIHRSTGGGLPALGGRELTANEAVIISKTLDMWSDLQRSAHKASKAEGIERNKPERALAAGWWTDLFKLFAIMEDTAQPALQELMAKPALTWNEQRLYFNLLMFCLMVTRPCRPSTYAAWYVCCCTTHEAAFGLSVARTAVLCRHIVARVSIR